MPRTILFDTEEHFEKELGKVLNSEEIKSFLEEGYLMSITVADVDDLTGYNLDPPLGTHGPHRHAGDAFLHDSMIDMCRFCSATTKSEVGAVYCWRFRSDRLAGLNVSKEPLELLAMQEKFIESRNREAKDVGDPTFSIGVARYPLDGDSPFTLFRIATDRMYEAKRRGKNQIVSEG